MGTRLQLEKRRQKAIEMLQAGRKYKEIAKELNCSISSLVRWKQAFKEKGVEGLKSKANFGRKSQLTEKQKIELFNDLLKGACKFGYSSEIWTLRRISKHIEKKYGISYSSFVSIWNILNKANWSCQKPEKRAIQRDEKTIKKWKQEIWPKIKKMSRQNKNVYF